MYPASRVVVSSGPGILVCCAIPWSSALLACSMWCREGAAGYMWQWALEQYIVHLSIWRTDYWFHLILITSNLSNFSGGYYIQYKPSGRDKAISHKLKSIMKMYGVEYIERGWPNLKGRRRIFCRCGDGLRVKAWSKLQQVKDWRMRTVVLNAKKKVRSRNANFF